MPITLDGTLGITTPSYGGADAAEYLVPVTAFKNRLINSQLLINQRGVSGTVSLSSGAYGHDRFKAGASGCTYTFSTSNNVTTLTITAGSLQQVVEGLNLESGTYALSWTGTAQGKIGAGSYSASGITGSITGGTNTTIEFNTGTLSLPQLEKGTTATSFDYRPYGTELALCERYYQIGLAGAVGRWNNSTTAEVGYSFRTQMRASPTVTHLNNYAASELGVAGRTVTNTTISGITQYGGLLNIISSGTTTGSIAGVSGTGVGFSAEL